MPADAAAPHGEHACSDLCTGSCLNRCFLVQGNAQRESIQRRNQTDIQTGKENRNGSDQYQQGGSRLAASSSLADRPMIPNDSNKRTDLTAPQEVRNLEFASTLIDFDGHQHTFTAMYTGYKCPSCFINSQGLGSLQLSLSAAAGKSPEGLDACRKS